MSATTGQTSLYEHPLNTEDTKGFMRDARFGRNLARDA